tara:strand:+ start:407 stop:574 length:168 start_codon:yes stop_codon:yes gene_type:complete
MTYEITLNILVDKDANFLEVSGNNCDVIKDLIRSALYDIDDIEIIKCEVLFEDAD